MILVFGGTGFIGRYFCSEMKERGVDILALGRSKAVQSFFNDKKIPFEYFDFNEATCFDKLPRYNIDAVIDLSACLAEIETPVNRFFEINTIGAYKVLDFAYRHDVKKVVLTSSHKLYNNIMKSGKIGENDPIDFTGDHSPYIISKIAAEYFAEWYNKDYDMNAIVLRLTGVHGYGEILGHLSLEGAYKKSTFEIFFEKALNGNPIEVWGDQTIKRDHVYIKDVVEALYKAAISEDAKGVFNIASGIGYSQYEEALALSEVFKSNKGKSKIICRPEMPGLSRGYIYDITKAKEKLNWTPKFTDINTMLLDYRMEWKKKTYHNYHHFKEGEAPATL